MSLVTPRKGYKSVPWLFGKEIEIPEEWEVIPIRNLILSHKQGFYTNEKYSKNGIRLVRITDLQNPNLDYDSMPYVEINKKLIDDFKVNVGDFLFARSGAIGRFGIVTKDIPCIFASYIIKFKFNEKILLNYFLGFFLQTNSILKQFNMIKQGSSNININAENIKSMKVITPPLLEQQKIATILSNVDNLIESTVQVITHSKKVKTGLMQKLLTRGIGHTKFKKIQFGVRWMNIQIPMEWRIESLLTVAKFRQGLQIDKSKRYTETGNNRMKLIQVTDFYEYRNSEEYIDTPNGSKQSVICNKDDILIARTGSTLGMILTNVEGVFHNNTFVLDYDRALFEKYYFYYFLKSPYVQMLIKIISTRTGQPDLTHKEFSILKIPIPPLPEQQKIASILSNIDSKITSQEQYKEKLEKLKKSLMQKLLTGMVRV